MVEEAPKTDQKQFHTIQETFYSVGFSCEGQMSTVEEMKEEIPNLVCHYLPNATLNN